MTFLSRQSLRYSTFHASLDLIGKNKYESIETSILLKHLNGEISPNLNLLTPFSVLKFKWKTQRM
jgi:hypothetical protein